jgi:hypothetical protein
VLRPLSQGYQPDYIRARPSDGHKGNLDLAFREFLSPLKKAVPGPLMKLDFAQALAGETLEGCRGRG